jgi:hypothetical protein
MTGHLFRSKIMLVQIRPGLVSKSGRGTAGWGLACTLGMRDEVAMSPVRPEERFAFAVVARVLATVVEPYDIRGRQGAVDAFLHHSDGRIGALEVSSIGPEDEARIIHYLDNRSHWKDIPGLTRKWLVEVPRSFHPADMPKTEKALLRCEKHAAEHLKQLGGIDRDVDYLLDRGVRANSVTGVTGEIKRTRGRAYFLLPWIGGFSSRGLESLPIELSEVLRTTKMQSKIDKLTATGRDERHLFLIVRPSAFSFPIYDGLAFGGPLPVEVPVLPDGLSQVWLLTGLQAGGVVRCTSGDGWSRDDPYGEPNNLAV